MDEPQNPRSDQADLVTDDDAAAETPDVTDVTDLEGKADDLAALAELEGNEPAAEALREVDAPVAMDDEPPEESVEDLGREVESLPPEADTLSEVEEESTLGAAVEESLPEGIMEPEAGDPVIPQELAEVVEFP